MALFLLFRRRSETHTDMRIKKTVKVKVRAREDFLDRRNYGEDKKGWTEQKRKVHKE